MEELAEYEGLVKEPDFGFKELAALANLLEKRGYLKPAMKAKVEAVMQDEGGGEKPKPEVEDSDVVNVTTPDGEEIKNAIYLGLDSHGHILGTEDGKEITVPIDSDLEVVKKGEEIAAEAAAEDAAKAKASAEEPAANAAYEQSLEHGWADPAAVAKDLLEMVDPEELDDAHSDVLQAHHQLSEEEGTFTVDHLENLLGALYDGGLIPSAQLDKAKHWLAEHKHDALSADEHAEASAAIVSTLQGMSLTQMPEEDRNALAKHYADAVGGHASPQSLAKVADLLEKHGRISKMKADILREQAGEFTDALGENAAQGAKTDLSEGAPVLVKQPDGSTAPAIVNAAGKEYVSVQTPGGHFVTIKASDIAGNATHDAYHEAKMQAMGLAAAKDTSKSAAEANEAGSTIEETTFSKAYKGVTHEVTKDSEGYHFHGKTYSSLTAIAKEITGYASISGPNFFGVANKEKSKTATIGKKKAAPDPVGTPVPHAGGPPPEFKGWAKGDHVRVLDEHGKIRDVRVVKTLADGSALLLDEVSGAYFQSGTGGVVAWLKADGSAVSHKPPPKDLADAIDKPGPPVATKDAFAKVIGGTGATAHAKLTAAASTLYKAKKAPPPKIGGTYPPSNIPYGAKKAAAHYTSQSGAFNAPLRGMQHHDLSESQAQEINTLGKAIDGTSFGKPMTVWRHTGVGFLKDQLGLQPNADTRHVAAAIHAIGQAGGTLRIDGFLSTSTKASIGAGFGGGTAATHVSLEIETPKGLVVKANSNYAGEDEIILGHGWHYTPGTPRYDTEHDRWIIPLKAHPKPHQPVTYQGLKKASAGGKQWPGIQNA